MHASQGTQNPQSIGGSLWSAAPAPADDSGLGAATGTGTGSAGSIVSDPLGTITAAISGGGRGHGHSNPMSKVGYVIGGAFAGYVIGAFLGTHPLLGAAIGAGGGYLLGGRANK